MKKFLFGLAACMVAVIGTAAASFPAFAETEAVAEMGAVYWTYNYGNGWSAETKDNDHVQAPENSYATAIWVELENQPANVKGTLSYQVNLSGSGWLDWQGPATEAGDIAGDMPLEAVRIKLTDQLAEQYDVYYSVFQSGAWTDLVMNGETAGVEAQGRRVDGLRVAIQRKGEGAPMDPWYAERNIDPSKPMVALTFDDGPAPATWRILDTLESHGARATFYMVGNRMSSYPDTVRRITALGCEIGSHTWGHNYITRLSAENLHANLNQFNTTLQQIAGIRSMTMRPPGGFVNEASKLALASYGVPAIMWSIDTLDWKTRSPQATVNTVLSQVRDGDIILMHDLYGTTADAAAMLVPELLNRGYQLVTVSDLARCRGGAQPGQVYHSFYP
ncbi:MAG: polysaccharide deacetylase family protein [Lachnospiraceae bacterium]|nr:polysaccharide deacetylase family protein [Lachnospiraceae bacterium]